MKETLMIYPGKAPRVLLLGNGILQLAGGGSWGELLSAIGKTPVDPALLKGVPYAMQPECICGVDVEDVQRRTAAAIADNPAHEALRRLLALPWDAVLTTNYTYEIEQVLSNKTWDDSQRRKAFRAPAGHPHLRHTPCICSMVTNTQKRCIPVFHIHGDRLRKHSLVLSYYSYANTVSRLIALNKQRGNIYQEKQEAGEPVQVLSWLDYFLLGEVYAVGFGFDTSEFDLWWAVERKARENASHGTLHAYMMTSHTEPIPQEPLFAAMHANLRRIIVTNGYEAAYDTVIHEIEKETANNGIQD